MDLAPYYLRAIAAQLSSRVSEQLLEEDLERLGDCYHGPYALAGTLRGPSLIMGGRSGLLAAIQALHCPEQEVYVVERDAALREAIRESVGQLGLSNLSLFASEAEGLAALETTDAGSDGDSSRLARLGFVGIERIYFSRQGLMELAQSFRIEQLTGEFDEAQANPLWLHRLSRGAAECFHWQNLTIERPMPGTGMTGPDVSVIVPAYGVEGYLDQCLGSLVDQTLESLEIIVVDDGAKDRSGQIADEWAQRDSRVRVIHQANAGCAAARSNGLAAARGMFIGLIDGDDWVDPPMFQALAESAVRFTSDIAQCGYRHCYDNGQGWVDEREHFALTTKIGSGNGLIADPKALIPGRPSIWRRLYRRDFLLGNGIDFPHTIRRFDDLPFHFMTLALAERLSIVNACYYNYRQERPGQDIGVDDERLYVHFPIFQILKDFVRQNHTRALEENLFMTQLASHEWASRVIQPRLRKQYRDAAKYDLFEDAIALRPGELLWRIWRYDRRRSRWAWRLKLRPGAGKEAWLAVRDSAR